MPDLRNRLKTGLLSGIKKGWHTFIWTLKILLPISFLMTLLQWSGWLDALDFLLNPLMSFLNLPPEAALAIISGMLINIYAVVAIITVIPFTTEQMTLIAVFSLIAHNLIMEGTVQHKSGFNVLKAAAFRITVAIVTVFIISRFMGGTDLSAVAAISNTVHPSIVEALKTWAAGTFFLLLKVIGIIMFIMILQELLVSLGWLDYIPRFFRPLMRVMGLPQQATLIWLATNIFGLLYGGAVVMEEAKKGTLTEEELKELHISIGINHSMTEDPSMFAVLGLNPFWLWVPRFVMAVVVLQSYKLLKRIWRRYFKK